MESKKLIWIFVWILIIVMVGIVLFNSVFYPAYMSVTADCHPRGIEILEEKGWVVAGSYSYNYETEEEEIYISPEFSDDKTIKHEWIHLKQREAGRFYSCDYIVLKYLNECEAYSFQNYPNWLFDWVYGFE